MTAGEPSADLRARVVDRLGEREAMRRWTWIAVPVAAAATSAIALLAARDRHAPVVAPQPTVAADRTSPALVPSTTPPATTAEAIVADAQAATPARATVRTASTRRSTP